MVKLKGGRFRKGREENAQVEGGGADGMGLHHPCNLSNAATPPQNTWYPEALEAAAGIAG